MAHLIELAVARARRTARRAHLKVRPLHGVDEIVRMPRPRSLQLGCGPNLLPGWINTDVDPVSGATYLDASRRFRFPDATFDNVFAEHMIEHLRLPVARVMLRECFRVIRPGGAIRIATPDLAFVASLALQAHEPEKVRYVKWSTDTFFPAEGDYRASRIVNNFFYGWGHKYIYDESTLRLELEGAGFVDVERFACGESDDPDLASLEAHGETAEDRALIALETLVLQGRRPEHE